MDENYTPYEYENQQNQTYGQAPQAEPKKKKSRVGLKVTALVLSCALVGGAAGVGSSLLMNRTGRSAEAAAPGQSTMVLQGERPTAAVNVAKIDSSKLMTASEVYAANVNSTVGITTSITTNYWGYQTQSAAAGSGFILTADGYILTNYHVVESANAIKVALYDGSSYDAQLIGYDESNDVAVLKIDAENLTPVVLGDSDQLNVGDNVIAIGNPLGELTFSLTSGVVSALDRSVTFSTGQTMNLIQTDCAINSGNSGGAMFNMYGEVVGITNAKYSGSQSSSSASIDNIGFAIPINHVRGIVTSIIEKGYYTEPYIGETVTNVGSESQSYGLPAGAAVRSVETDSPAAQAGLQSNDIITEVNGTAIDSSSALVSVVSGCAVGDTLNVKVYRQGQELTLSITVGEKQQSALPDTSASDAQGQQGQDAQQNQNSQDAQNGQNGQQGQGSYGFPWGYFFGG